MHNFSVEYQVRYLDGPLADDSLHLKQSFGFFTRGGADVARERIEGQRDDGEVITAAMTGNHYVIVGDVRVLTIL